MTIAQSSSRQKFPLNPMPRSEQSFVLKSRVTGESRPIAALRDEYFMGRVSRGESVLGLEGYTEGANCCGHRIDPACVGREAGRNPKASLSQQVRNFYQLCGAWE
jgi:hypothetical protein